MKETIKVLSLFCLIFLIALTPWLLLRRESSVPDDTIHRQPVTLEAPEEPADTEADAVAASGETAVEEKLRLLYRAAVSSETYSISSVRWDTMDLALLGEVAQLQMEALVVQGALPSMELGNLGAVEPVEQVTFYDPEDATEIVRVLTVYLYYEYYMVFAVMDLDTNLFYAVAIQEPANRDEEFSLTDVRPTGFLEYLGMEESVEIYIANYGNYNGYFGNFYSTEDENFLLTFNITGKRIIYCPESLAYLGLMQY